jgi:hypothetical protein
MISSTLFVACKDGDSSGNDASFDSSIATSTRPAVDSTALTMPTGTATIPTGTLQSTPQTVPVGTTTTPTITPSTTPTATTTAPGMNPPHGQPGHRCDISVGAPLNSAPATTTTTTATTPTVTANQPVVNTTPMRAVKTAPGMNPPHGQPGHRCDIAVGAPLNSAPTKTTVPVVPNTDPGKVSQEVSRNLASPVSVAVDTAKKQ